MCADFNIQYSTPPLFRAFQCHSVTSFLHSQDAVGIYITNKVDINKGIYPIYSLYKSLLFRKVILYCEKC